ncbi:flagellar basal body rod protein FlgB [Lachnospiraceae bacterium LCP25S3_G4]
MDLNIGNTLAMSEKALDYLWKKQQVTMNNIANVDTPGYRSQYVAFEDEFKKKLEAAGATGKSSNIKQAIVSTQPKVYSSEPESARLDENNVNMDTENVELARTTLQYQYLLDSVTKDITRYRTVIKG